MLIDPSIWEIWGTAGAVAAFAIFAWQQARRDHTATKEQHREDLRDMWDHVHAQNEQAHADTQQQISSAEQLTAAIHAVLRGVQ